MCGILIQIQTDLMTENSALEKFMFYSFANVTQETMVVTGWRVSQLDLRVHPNDDSESKAVRFRTWKLSRSLERIVSHKVSVHAFILKSTFRWHLRYRTGATPITPN